VLDVVVEAGDGFLEGFRHARGAGRYQRLLIGTR
jgi:hypothetical protein